MKDRIFDVLMNHLDQRISLEDSTQTITVGNLTQEIMEVIQPSEYLDPTQLIQRMDHRGLKITRQFIRECQAKRITSEEEAVQFLKARK